MTMEFKRKESFRHNLENPIDIDCFVSHSTMEIGVQAKGQIVDISPQGLRITLMQPLPKDVEECVLQLEFKIHERIIRAEGEAVWNHPSGDEQYRYGIRLHSNEMLQETIIEELKLRRRAEVFSKKK